MKNTLFIILAAMSILYASCKKNNDGPGEVYGKWKLTETMQDPGDGSGKYIKATGAEKYITLEKSGKFDGDAIPELLTFKILDSVKMEVTSTAQNRPYIYYYKVSASSLTLNPPCIEGCGFRFVRK